MSTRENILEVAENFILERGYNAFSFQDLADMVGIKKASIHYHYPTKEDLGRAIVQKFRLDFKEWAKNLDNQGFSHAEKLDAYFLTYKRFITQRDKICLSGVLGAELNSLSEGMQEELRGFFQDRFKWLKQLLIDGLYHGEFKFTLDVDSQTMLILASVQGVLQIARTNNSPEYFLTVTRVLKNNLIGMQMPVGVKF